MIRIFSLVLLLILLAPPGSHAFLGFGGDRDQDKSGLDLKQGYDVNTVVTLTGQVRALPQVTAQKNVLIEVKCADETVYLAVGPDKFWEKGKLALKLNDVLTVKGSRAQGKDGRQYLLVQKLTNLSSGAQLELRDPQGAGLWSASGAPAADRRDGMGGALRGGDPSRGGGMLRGGDLLRGGGMTGGGMRR